jgi:ditrans,polycis-polyprenyl diphosphate synthase
MDGNRRFAELRGLGKEKGHEFGAEKLLEVLQWSLALGVECLSVYAFSTDNFKRSSAEVDVLFELAERKLDEMASSPVIHSHNVRIQVLGELHMLPAGTRRAAFNAMARTKAYVNGPVLNVCFAYTGREDLCAAVCAMGSGVRTKSLDPVDGVTERTLERLMHGAQFDGGPMESAQTMESGDGDHGSIETTSGELPAFDDRKPGAPPVDLLIRTSGETRLSDFMLWGISGHAVLCFQEVLWPDFSFTDMCYAVWTYQKSAEHSSGGRARYHAQRSDAECERRLRLRNASGGNGASKSSERVGGASRRVGRPKGSVGSEKAANSRVNGTSVAEVAFVSEGGGGADAFVAERNRAFVRETLETTATVAVTT